MEPWTCDEGGSVRARDKASAETKLGRHHGAAVTNVQRDALGMSIAELPDCSCGWSGKGTGPGGRFVGGDKCPKCGEALR